MVRFPTSTRQLLVAVAALFAVTLAACSQQDKITTYEESETESVGPVGHAGAKAAPTAATIPHLTFDTPEGWVQGRVGGMRKAAFAFEKDGKRVDITAIDLTASAGALLPNVNRWRQQIKLGEITQEELEKSISDIEVAGAKGSYVELIGPKDDERPPAILAVVVIEGDRSWFFKLWGDKELALQQKEHFQQFVKSVKFHSGRSAMPKAAPLQAAHAAAKKSPLLKYSTPKGWVSSKVGGMRKAAFQVKEGEKSVEITVIDLAKGAGELLPNVNRWRGQIKLKATTQSDLDSQLKSISVAGQKGHYVKLIGPKDAKPPLAILGVLLSRKDRIWFFKMMGDADLVLKQEKPFEEFVKSITFAEAGGDND